MKQNDLSLLQNLPETPKTELTWRNVFDLKHWYGHIDRYFPVVVLSGYEYFVWNDRIYRVCGFTFEDTGFTVDDVK